MRRRKYHIRLGKLLAFILVIIALCGALVYAAASIYRYVSMKSDTGTAETASAPDYYLLVGINNDPVPSAETVIVCSVDRKTKHLDLISVPASTSSGLGIDAKNQITVGEAYRKGGVIEAKSCIENLMHIRINHFIIFNEKTFNEAMNHFGNINLYVEQEMMHNKGDGTADFHLYTGYQTLDANGAMAYVRYMDPEQDEIARIQRQQRFMKTCLLQMQQHYAVTNWEMVRHYWAPYYSNVTYKEAASLAYDITGFPAENIQFAILPGEMANKDKNTKVWVVNPIEMQKTIASTMS